jgi:hypothetical protein
MLKLVFKLKRYLRFLLCLINFIKLKSFDDHCIISAVKLLTGVKSLLYEHSKNEREQRNNICPLKGNSIGNSETKVLIQASIIDLAKNFVLILKK